MLLGFPDGDPPSSEVRNSAAIGPEGPREASAIPALTSGDGDPMISAPLHYRDSPLANDLQSSHSQHSCASDADHSDACSMSCTAALHSDSEGVSVPGIGPPRIAVASLIPVLSPGN